MKQPMQQARKPADHFAFGENWPSFAQHLDQAKIEFAEAELIKLLGLDTLRGRTFLDIGCGTLLSLARRPRPLWYGLRRVRVPTCALRWA